MLEVLTTSQLLERTLMNKELEQILRKYTKHFIVNTNQLIVSCESIFIMLSLTSKLKEIGYVRDITVPIKVLKSTGVCGTKFIKA